MGELYFKLPVTCVAEIATTRGFHRTSTKWLSAVTNYSAVSLKRHAMHATSCHEVDRDNGR